MWRKTWLELTLGFSEWGTHLTLQFLFELGVRMWTSVGPIIRKSYWN